MDGLSRELMKIDQLTIEEVKKIEHKTDDELMKMYFQQVTKRNPSMIAVRSLETIFKNRKLVPKDLNMFFNYVDKDGNEKTVQVATI